MEVHVKSKEIVKILSALPEGVNILAINVIGDEAQVTIPLHEFVLLIHQASVYFYKGLPVYKAEYEGVKLSATGPVVERDEV
jgi:hypothetical protein